MQSNPKDARACCDTYYFSARPCVRGHICPRFTSTHACIKCLDDAKKRYRALSHNKEKIKKYNVEYRYQNSERLKTDRLDKYKNDSTGFRKASKAWKIRNLERVRTYASKYKKLKPGENAARAAKYIADKKKATPPWADLSAIKQIYIAARKLSAETGIPHDVDHIHPLNGRNSCGLHVHYNLQPLPARENQIKHNKVPDSIEGYSKLVADRLAAK